MTPLLLAPPKERCDRRHRSISRSPIVGLPRPKHPALPTMPSFPLVDVEVRASQRVAVDAMSLSRLTANDAISSSQVLTDCNRLQVPRIAARAVAAQMIEVPVARNWAAEHQVRSAMRFYPHATPVGVAVTCQLVAVTRIGPALVAPVEHRSDVRGNLGLTARRHFPIYIRAPLGATGIA